MRLGVLCSACSNTPSSVPLAVAGFMQRSLETDIIVCGRRQGMRLGALFSSVLDPSKPPLFGADADLALLPQEAWHPGVAGTTLS